MQEFLMWLVICLLGISALLTIGNIGKHRPTITPGMACFVVVVNALVMLAIYYVGTH